MNIPNNIPSYTNPIERFGYKKMSSIQKFLRKISDDEIVNIRGIEIQKKLETQFVLESYPIKPVEVTTMIINYYGYQTKGIYWNISVKPTIENMIVDVFGLKNQGIDNVSLRDISERGISLNY
jgi:hypothetical protein